jgi:V/A-type H+/Na+-transporting ATPase subunit C
MAAVVQYSALSGKTRAMHGQILSEGDYRELMRRDSVAGIAEYLRQNTHYAPDLADCDVSDIHRGRLEKMLRLGLMRDYGKLATFCGGKLRLFVRAVFRKHEIESLKLLFRAFIAGDFHQELLEDTLQFLSQYERLNISRLATSRDASEFVANLQGTAYGRHLLPYLGAGADFPLFQMEMALDTLYYHDIARSLKRTFEGEDEAILSELYGSEIDLFNLLMTYRCKVFYRMDRDLINSYWVDHHHRISAETRTQLLDATDREGLLAVLAQTPYRELFRNPDERFFDVDAQNWLYQRHARLFRQKAFSVACLVSYLRIRETELHNLVSLIECVRYRLPEDQLVRYLMGWTSRQG